jgi:hypothetical protein
MKQTNTCPKCQSKDIFRVPGGMGPGNSGDNILAGWTVFSAVKVSRYLCAQCGYSEERIDDKEDIEKLRHRYAH